MVDSSPHGLVGGSAGEKPAFVFNNAQSTKWPDGPHVQVQWGKLGLRMTRGKAAASRTTPRTKVRNLTMTMRSIAVRLAQSRCSLLTNSKAICVEPRSHIEQGIVGNLARDGLLVRAAFNERTKYIRDGDYTNQISNLVSI
jgi:hypothetical protein